MAYDNAPTAAARQVTQSLKDLVTVLGGNSEAGLPPANSIDDALTHELKTMNAVLQNAITLIEALL